MRPLALGAAGILLAAFCAAPAAAQNQATQAAGNTQAMLIDWDSTPYDWAQTAPLYAGVTLNAWNAAWVPQIHAANPAAKVYVYADAASTRSNDCGTNPAGGAPCIVNGVICPAGVNDAPFHAGGLGFCATWRHHRDWFLRNASGALIVYSGFPAAYMMDYGNPCYQKAWAQAVTSEARAGGWDGVLADNVLDRNNYGTPAKYPSDAATQAAMRSMLATVGPVFQAAGVALIGNLGYANLYPSLWAQWLPYVSGFTDEFSWYWGDNSPQGPGGFNGWMEAQVQACASASKTCFFHIGSRTDPLSQAQIDYGTASYLLYADGGSYLGYGGDNAGQAPSVSLGAALGPATQDSGGIWHRDFAGGSVSVDVAAGTGTVTGLP